MKVWRLLPKISYTNWSDTPGMSQQWPTVKRYWPGRLIYLQWFNHQIKLDFRKSWIDDMVSSR